MIRLENISKRYFIQFEKQALVKNVLPGVFRKTPSQELWALRDINLFVRQGECLGIIGRNGSGKSTLLKILAGITAPTEGSVMVQGSVATLLSIGAGFHPELTGRENIFLNGAILGYDAKVLEERCEAIIEFSELGKFIEAPLRTYSNGMYLRLGFSIAINTDFEILLIDEILTVGDCEFQNKCFSKIKELQNSGKTIVMATHEFDRLQRFCDKVIVLGQGSVIFIGVVDEAIALYHGQSIEHKGK